MGSRLGPNSDTLIIKMVNIQGILTKTAESDESSHHERWMQVELLVRRFIGPGVAIAVVEHPEYG